jgi:hypothetical protein
LLSVVSIDGDQPPAEIGSEPRLRDALRIAARDREQDATFVSPHERARKPAFTATIRARPPATDHSAPSRIGFLMTYSPSRSPTFSAIPSGVIA